MKDFLLGIGFDLDKQSFSKFKDGIKKASDSVSGLSKKINKMNFSLFKGGSGAFKSTLALTGLTLATNLSAGAIYRFTAGAAKQIETTDLLAKRLNSTSKEVEQLGYIASLSASSVEAMNSSLDNLNRISGEAAIGVGRGSMLFKKLGLSAKGANGQLKSTTQLMTEISKKIAPLSKAEQIATLSKLGIDPSLIQMMTTDVAHLREEFSQLYDSAGIKSEEAAQNATEFLDSIHRLQFAFGVFRKSVAAEFFKPLQASIDKLRKSFILNMPKIKQSVVSGFKGIFSITKSFFQVGKRVWKLFTDLHKATNGWSTGLFLAGAAWKVLNATMLRTPAGQVLALGSAVALLVDDIMGFKEGKNSAFDWTWLVGDGQVKGFFQWIAEDTGIGKAIGTLTAYFVEMGSAIAAVFTGNGAQALEHFKNAIKAVAQTLLNLVEVIVGPLKGGFEAVNSVVDSIFSTAKKIGGSIIDIPQNAADTASAIGNKVKNHFSDRVNNLKTLGNPNYPKSAAKTAPIINQEINFTIQGGGDANAISRAMVGQMSRVNGDLARNFTSPIQ